MSRPEASILHVDLDAFFASVEQLLDPSLRGKPVIVGGTGRRGVVAAASYEARKFGVHSALPTARARRLCPHGVYLPPRIDVYQGYSRDVFAILRSVTPLVEPLSLDEAFLDVAGARRRLGTGPEVAAHIRERVRDETGLTCSVGVATTKLLAKLASDEAKPDGMFVVEPGSELEFLHPLPVGRLWGVGPATGERLARLGVRTVGELAEVPEATLVGAVGAAHGTHLHALAWNRDHRPVSSESETKSVSAEETFPTDLFDREALAREVRRLSDLVAGRLRQGQWVGRTVTVKVRFPDFRTVTRSETLPFPTDAATDVASTATALFQKLDLAEGVRLVGVGVSNLERPGPRQESLPFDGAPRPQVDDAVDAVRRKFGTGAVGPASLVEGGELRTGRRSAHDWGPDE